MGKFLEGLKVLVKRKDSEQPRDVNVITITGERVTVRPIRSEDGNTKLRIIRIVNRDGTESNY